MFQGDIQWMLREIAHREMFEEAERLRLVKRLPREPRWGRCGLIARRFHQRWRERCAHFTEGEQEPRVARPDRLSGWIVRATHVSADGPPIPLLESELHRGSTREKE